MKKFIIIAMCSVTIITSCVSKKKLHKEQSVVQNLRNDSTNTHQKLNESNSKLGVTNSRLNNSEKEKTAVQNDLQNVTSNAETASEISKMTIEQSAKRLRDLQAIVQAQKDVLNKLKKSVADALVNFKPDELSVSVKDGNLYVSLQEKLLFKSGSAVVDPKGKEALKTLADVLNSTTDIKVNIEGHTDNVPIKGIYEDNWALSVSRATSIVRILTKDYKVEPNTIIASGRSEFYPIDDNTTEAGKARNRRTEIILSPNLNKLFELLNQ